MDISTIKVRKDTQNRLKKMKIHPGETYEEVIKKLLSILNLCRNNPFLARQKLREIDHLKEKLKNISK
jgi:predicted CopG family antitoxin